MLGLRHSADEDEEEDDYDSRPMVDGLRIARRISTAEPPVGRAAGTRGALNGEVRTGAAVTSAEGPARTPGRPADTALPRRAV